MCTSASDCPRETIPPGQVRANAKPGKTATNRIREMDILTSYLPKKVFLGRILAIQVPGQPQRDGVPTS
jgi:hypothetical protein